MANARLGTQFGYEKGELLGQFVETLILPRWRGRYQAHRSAVLAHPKTMDLSNGSDLIGCAKRRDGALPLHSPHSPDHYPRGLRRYVRDRSSRVRMNPRLILIMCVLAFIGLLLIVGARTFSRWVKIHYPRQASAVLLGLWHPWDHWRLAHRAGNRDEPTYQPNDLITLQQPVVVKTIALERDSRAVTCVVDLHEHLGVMEIQRESGTLKARVESNNSSAALYCPVGSEVHVEIAWLHRPTVTRRE